MNTISVLGQSFVDAQFALLGVGFTILPPVLVLNNAPGVIQMLMADSTLITADDQQDYIDADPTILPPPYVVSQSPAPGVFYDPAVLNIGKVIQAIGYSVPTVRGPIPVP